LGYGILPLPPSSEQAEWERKLSIHLPENQIKVNECEKEVLGKKL
jgi:hypothetical protein